MLWKGCELAPLLDEHLVTFLLSAYLQPLGHFKWQPGRSFSWIAATTAAEKKGALMALVADGNCYYSVMSCSPGEPVSAHSKHTPTLFSVLFHLDILLSTAIKSFAIKNLNFFVYQRRHLRWGWCFILAGQNAMQWQNNKRKSEKIHPNGIAFPIDSYNETLSLEFFSGGGGCWELNESGKGQLFEEDIN